MNVSMWVGCSEVGGRVIILGCFQVVQLIRQVVRELAGYMDQLVTQANILNKMFKTQRQTDDCILAG